MGNRPSGCEFHLVVLLQQFGVTTVSSAQDHRQKAKRYLDMANDCSDPHAAEALRILAASHLASAQEFEAAAPVAQQQQQIQPPDPE